MTLMHGHIEAYRALADAMEDEVDHLKVASGGSDLLVCQILTAEANAYRRAALTLERAEMSLLERVTSFGAEQG